MNKMIIKKSILVLVLIILLSIVSVGCTIIGSVTIPIRGTVYITIDEDYRKAIDPVPTYYYNIFMDGDFKGTIKSDGILVLRKVSLGIHFFEAWDVSRWYYGNIYQTIFSGTTNYVEIPVELAY